MANNEYGAGGDTSAGFQLQEFNNPFANEGAVLLPSAAEGFRVQRYGKGEAVEIAMFDDPTDRIRAHYAPTTINESIAVNYRGRKAINGTELQEFTTRKATTVSFELFLSDRMRHVGLKSDTKDVGTTIDWLINASRPSSEGSGPRTRAAPAAEGVQASPPNLILFYAEASVWPVRLKKMQTRLIELGRAPWGSGVNSGGGNIIVRANVKLDFLVLPFKPGEAVPNKR